MEGNPWTVDGWRKKRSCQQPSYSDEQAYASALRTLRTVPPIVFTGEVDRMKAEIAEAAEGRRFILQGGDCVERFEDCNETSITNKIKILLQMSVILTYAARRPLLRIGRMAGQFFKPRSQSFELIDGVEIPVYRGDGINGIEPTPEGRAHDPERLPKSYYHSAVTLNFVRAMISGGFADLHNPYNWNLHTGEDSPQWREYRDILEHIVDAVTFMESFGGLNSGAVNDIDFFTSHEGLHLDYEEALTRPDPASGRSFNIGAHMLWIGERTRQLDGAHVEYFRGIANPIGLKIGATIDPAELVDTVKVLNPQNEPGRITLISRLGASMVLQVLPRLIDAVRDAGLRATWSCDPMHGNTVLTRDSVKTRRFEDVLAELTSTFEVHRELARHLGGVHFELTGEDVTECTGGAVPVSEADLAQNYQSYCDPRLNYLQSMELSFLISRHLKRHQA